MGTGVETRDCLRRLHASLAGPPALLYEVVRSEGPQPARESRVLLDRLDENARVAQAVLALALARPGIESALEDRVNALIPPGPCWTSASWV